MTDTPFSFEPVSAGDLPRFAGMPSFMRLPHVPMGSDHFDKVDIGIIGVPWDGGTSNRPGPRHGPRQLRDLSTMIRDRHQVSGLRPFSTKNCADLGDCPINPIDLMAALDLISGYYTKIAQAGITPLTAGGDHLISLPILRGLAQNGPLGMIHFDAHTDLADSAFGGVKYHHGTPFRRAIEEGLLDPKRVVQIGIRGTKAFGDVEWGLEQGVRIITIEEWYDLGIKAVMDEARQIVGDHPTYVSFDIDSIDPAFAPGTGTPEIGGFTSLEAQLMVRKLGGLNLVGADLVEVSPPFDQSGATAWLGASIMFELLCVLVEGMG